MRPIILASRLFLRAAVFLWMTPLPTALSSRLATVLYWAVASWAALPSTSSVNFRVLLRTRERIILFLCLCVSLWRFLFAA